MRAFRTIMFLFLWVAAVLSGCAAPPEKPSQITGVKLRDLSPADATRRGMTLPPSVNLKAVTFSIPAAGYERAVRLALSAMDSGPGILRNPADFGANGFVAATGRINKLDSVSAILNQAQATLLTSNYYAVFDNRGDDIDMAVLQQITSVAYSNKGASEKLSLKPGRLVIRMTVTRFTSRASVFRMTVQPVWKPRHDTTFVERISGRSRHIAFSAAAIDTGMQAGEMILIAPSPSAQEGASLASTMMCPLNGESVKLTIIICTGIE